MAYTTVYQDIVFIEGTHERAYIICDIKSEPRLAPKAGRKTLSEVKRDLAEKAISFCANCVTDFTYGRETNWQTKTSTLAGSGKCAVLPKDVYYELLEKHCIQL